MKRRKLFIIDLQACMVLLMTFDMYKLWHEKNPLSMHVLKRTDNRLIDCVVLYAIFGNIPAIYRRELAEKSYLLQILDAMLCG